MKRKQKFILIGGIILVLLILSSLAIKKLPTEIDIYFSKKDCESKGGSWLYFGISGEMCNFPTSDAGKECSSGNQCEGDCLADLQGLDINKVTSGTVDAIGKCTKWKFNDGCNAYVENGKVNGILCTD